MLRGAIGRQPGRGVEQQFQGPPIAAAFGQAAVAMGVGVDQTGYDQAFAGVDGLGLGRCRCARCHDLSDAVVTNE